MKFDADSLPYVALDIREEFELAAKIGREAVSNAHSDDDEKSLQLDEFGMKDRDLVRIFLCTCTDNVVGWVGNEEFLHSNSLRYVLYNDPLKNEVLGSYVDMLFFHYDVQHKEEAEKFVKGWLKNKCPDSKYKDAYAMFSKTVSGVLKEIGKLMREQYKYVVVPLNSHYHWHLLILHVESAIFYH